MARRRRSEEVSISLFPFLSILACVIGVLTLVIMSLSLSQIAQGRENADVARAEERASVKKRIEAMLAQIDKLGKDKTAAMKKIKLETEVAALKDQVKPPPDAKPEDDLKEKLAEIDRMIAAQTLAKQKFEELKKKPKVLD